MELLSKLLEGVVPLLPTAGLVAILFVALMALHRLLERRAAASHRRFGHQIFMLVLSLLGLLAVILTLPVSDAFRGQLLGLAGILLSAMLALSSTTLLGNAMAGVMLRAVRSFRSGDFVRVGDHYGRVSERGLFHTEIQTEDRDLTTLPNLYLVTHPVTVTRSTGTIVSATVSLGYDVPRDRVHDLLLQAAGESGLQEPFVQVLELGDFSVTYRVAGLLSEVKQVISTRSALRCKVMDALHDGGVEIVSPNFMNQRILDESQKFVPRRTRAASAEALQGSTPEALLFDKAEQAESVEKMQERYRQLGKDIEADKELLKTAEEPDEKQELEHRIELLKRRRQALAEMAKAKEAELED